MTEELRDFCKLEWRIQHFEKLTHILEYGQMVASKPFKCKKVPAVVWELHVYPNGKREQDSKSTSFFLRQVGLEPIRDICASVEAEFKVYLAGQRDLRLNICHDVKKFAHQQGRGKFQVDQNIIKNALQADASLLVICEIQFQPPSDSYMTEFNLMQQTGPRTVRPAKSKTNLAPKNTKGLWENMLFSDCAIEVGSNVFPAHRCILAQHSPVFRSMFSHSSTLEAQKRKVTINDCSAVINSAAQMQYYSQLMTAAQMQYYSQLMTAAQMQFVQC